MLIHLDDEWFIKIKDGIKTIELRLYDEKRRKLNIGDIIEFENRLNGEKIKCKVINLYIFKNFKELYENLDNNKFGFDNKNNITYKDMEAYYSLNDQEKYGVIGIEIELYEK